MSAPEEAARIPSLDLRTEASGARLAQLFRYAQVGRCVNGVAHDINNVLGAIMAYTELVALDENLDEESRRMLDEVIKGVTKCSQFVSALTGIARKDKPNISVVDPAQMLEFVLPLRTYDLRKERIQFESEIEPGLPSIAIDVPKVQLALIYLLMNAQEALTDAGTKRVKLRARAADQGVVFEVWNSAPPIPPSLAEQIFEPLVTTKEGHHLGMGLAAVREIAALHDGSIHYDPARGFVMYLPRENGLNASV